MKNILTYWKKMNNSFKLIILVILVITLVNLDMTKTVVNLMDKNIGLLKSQSIEIFVSENYKDNKTFLSWAIPKTKLHNHIELYKGNTLSNSYRENGERIPFKSKNQSYILLDNSKAKEYYSLYSIDRFGRYSKPKSLYLESNEQNYFSKGLFKFNYSETEIYYPYYILENDKIKVTLSRGVLIGIENKDNDKIIFNTNFNFLNSYLTQMDIYGKKIIFALYRHFYEDDLSWIEVQNKNKSIVFTRHYKNDNRIEEVIYSLVDSKTIKVSYHSDFSENMDAVRINFLGDDNYKSITRWTAENVSSIINEPKFDDTNLSFINRQYNKESLVDYQHDENIFNDSFPYLETRKFLNINTIFNLFNNENKIFSMYGATDKYFFYKNCSGEEGFMFGYKFPYMSGTKTIKNDFTIYIKVEY